MANDANVDNSRLGGQQCDLNQYCGIRMAGLWLIGLQEVTFHYKGDLSCLLWSHLVPTRTQTNSNKMGYNRTFRSLGPVRKK